MSRVKRGVTKHAHHASLLKQAKGFYGRRKSTFRIASQAVDRSLQNAYIGRRLRKRDFRALWIQRINAASRLYGLTYSQLIAGLAAAKLDLNRKILADLGMNDLAAFAKLAKLAQESLDKTAASSLAN